MTHVCICQCLKHAKTLWTSSQAGNDRLRTGFFRIALMLLLSLTPDHVFFNQTFGASIHFLFNLCSFSALVFYKPSDSTFSLNQSSVLPQGQNEKLFRKIMAIRLQCAGLLYKLQVKGKYHRAASCNNTECGTLKKSGRRNFEGHYTLK